MSKQKPGVTIMIEKLRSVVILSVILFVTVIAIKPGLCIGHKLVSEKRYVCKSDDTKESYTATLTAPEDQLLSPFWLTLYNGYGDKPGYSWVKVDLEPIKGQAKSGESLADDHTFQHSHAKTIDLTGYFSNGPRTIKIEGSGKNGAFFAWTFTTAPQILQLFRASTVTPGENFMIHGFGFGLDPKKVEVTLDDMPCKIIKVKNALLEARAPENFTGIRAVLRAKVGQKQSNQLSIITKYKPPHLVKMSPLGGNTGDTFTIRGANFSRVKEENIVKIGPYTAPVLEVLDPGTMICRIPDVGMSSTRLPLTVTTNSVKSDNYLDFWCKSNMF